MSDLRQVAAPPWEEDLLVTAEFERVVHVWSRRRAVRCATFETVYDFGGRRGVHASRRVRLRPER